MCPLTDQSDFTHNTFVLVLIFCGIIAFSVFVFVLVCVAAISPSAHSYNETLSTLRYAAHARNIVNKPRVNEVIGCLESDAKM